MYDPYETLRLRGRKYMVDTGRARAGIQWHGASAGKRRKFWRSVVLQCEYS